jgi:SsrA-binding protein
MQLKIQNKKARFDYEVISEIECGIVLNGTEIKSVRKGSVDLKDTYARIKNNEVFVINMYIAKYEEGNIFNHEERRERKLLLNKKEILKLRREIEQNAYTLVPLKLYFYRDNAKILLGLCKGKKLYDKRQSIKERDLKREEARY